MHAVVPATVALTMGVMLCVSIGQSRGDQQCDLDLLAVSVGVPIDDVDQHAIIIDDKGRMFRSAKQNLNSHESTCVQNLPIFTMPARGRLLEIGPGSSTTVTAINDVYKTDCHYIKDPNNNWEDAFACYRGEENTTKIALYDTRKCKKKKWICGENNKCSCD